MKPFQTYRSVLFLPVGPFFLYKTVPLIIKKIYIHIYISLLKVTHLNVEKYVIQQHNYVSFFLFLGEELVFGEDRAMVEDAYSTFTSSGGEERESTESQYSQSDESDAEEKDSDVDYGDFSSGPESIQEAEEEKERVKKQKKDEVEEKEEEGGDTDDSDEEEDEIRGSADLEDEEEEDESRGSEDMEDEEDEEEEEFREYGSWEDEEDEEESGDIDLDAVTIIYTRHKRGFPLFREYMVGDDFNIYIFPFYTCPGHFTTEV